MGSLERSDIPYQVPVSVPTPSNEISERTAGSESTATSGSGPSGHGAIDLPDLRDIAHDIDAICSTQNRLIRVHQEENQWRNEQESGDPRLLSL